MNQPDLLAYNLATIEKMLAEALRHAREGDVLFLASSPLATCQIIERWYVADTPQGSAELGRAVQALLWWLIERIRPHGERHWLALPWRPYNVLAGFYIEGLRIADLAEAMGVVEQTIYPIRNQALHSLAKLLLEELQQPSTTIPNHAIIGLYPQLTVAEQTLARMLAFNQQPLAQRWLEHWLELNAIAEPTIQQLADHGLIKSESLALVEKLRPFLQSQISAPERRRWHQQLAELLQPSEPLQSIQHWLQAQTYDQAASLIVAEHQTIVDNLQGRALRELLTQIQAHDIQQPQLWFRLKLVSGDVAMTMNDVQTALGEYQAALAANEPLLKAEAYYKRGKAFRSQSTMEAQAHFNYSIAILERAAPNDPLRYRVCLEQAWMWFQDQRDFEQAQTSLEQAASLIDPLDRGAWAELANARGMFYAHRGEHAEAINQHQAAWLAANEVNHSLLMTHIAHNLGYDYLDLGHYSQALDYFEQSLNLADRTGNRRMQGLCQKSIGACCFWMQEFTLAVEHYLAAYQIFAAMHNHNWQANTCYDLAEAYAELGQSQLMRHYYAEAIQLAQASGLDRLLNDLHGLAENYPGLYPPTIELNERQQRIFDYLKHHASITNRDYRELTQISPKQAARDLNDLVERNVLVRSGDGRSTSYQLPQSKANEA